MIPGKELGFYLSHLRENYAIWAERTFGDADPHCSRRMKESFGERIDVRSGRKYMKVFISGTVHSYIVLEPAKGFRQGDILKAAKNGPSFTIACGNVLDRNYTRVDWQGAH